MADLTPSFIETLQTNAAASGVSAVPDFSDEQLRSAKDADLPGILSSILATLQDHEKRITALESGSILPIV